ncbi:MAG TPA: hypothetical protein ENG30_03405 [Thermofilaceae archaeon]|nr:hypothetical protein [Thermofilaceae archaeon]
MSDPALQDHSYEGRRCGGVDAVYRVLGVGVDGTVVMFASIGKRGEYRGTREGSKGLQRVAAGILPSEICRSVVSPSLEGSPPFTILRLV